MSPVLSSVVVVLVVLVALLSLVASAPAKLMWDGNQKMDTARRGVACAAPREYDITTGSYHIASFILYYDFGFDGSSWTNTDWYLQSIDPWNFTELDYPGGTVDGREGHFLHIGQNVSARWLDQSALAMGGGRQSTGTDYLGGFYMDQVSGDWVPAVPAGSLLPPVGVNSWNWTTAPVIDTLHDNSYLTILYGGWIAGSPGYVDNHFYIAETNITVQLQNTITAGITSPFSLARQGVAIAGFNQTGDDLARGVFVVMGGKEWRTGVLHNDVWVATTPRPTGNWTRWTNTPWAPRWGSQAFDGGRLGIFLYGGYVASKMWENDVWYAQFSGNGRSTAPVWSLIEQTPPGGGPPLMPSCGVAYWDSDYALYLVMMGSHTDDNATGSGVVDPTQALWAGKIVYT